MDIATHYSCIDPHISYFSFGIPNSLGVDFKFKSIWLYLHALDVGPCVKQV